MAHTLGLMKTKLDTARKGSGLRDLERNLHLGYKGQEPKILTGTNDLQRIILNDWQISIQLMS